MFSGCWIFFDNFFLKRKGFQLSHAQHDVLTQTGYQGDQFPARADDSHHRSCDGETEAVCGATSQQTNVSHTSRSHLLANVL